MYVLKHHLIPRTKGFTASLSVLKKKCPAIMDVQLVFAKDDKVGGVFLMEKFIQNAKISILSGQAYD